MPRKSTSVQAVPAMARSSSAAAAGAARFRSRTGSKSIRGHISGPIPMPDPLEEEFTWIPLETSRRTLPLHPTHKHTVSAIEIRDLHKSELHQPDLHNSARQPPTVAPRSFSRPGTGRTASRPNHSRHQSEAWSTVLRQESQAQRPQEEAMLATQRSTFRDSAPSGHSPQRSKSVIRTALGKLFGRRKSARVSESTTRSYLAPLAESVQQHHSDVPSVVRRSPSPILERFDSSPVPGYDRALRSHSISPEDVLTIQSVRNSINAEYNVARRRAATTTEAHPASARWAKPTTGLTPRPASTQDWGNRLVDATHDPEEIGRAITTGLKRRSRSMSFIPLIDYAPTPSIKRRRSDDLLSAWRESYDQSLMSPLSSTAPEGDETQEFVTEKPESIFRNMAPSDESQPAVQMPVKPFPLADQTFMSEMAGMNMKITEAASLETRINGIESRLGRVEELLTQACSVTSTFGSQAIFNEQSATAMATAALITRPTSQSSAQHSRMSRMSGETPTYVGSIYQHAASHHVEFPNAQKPTSTIRGTSSLPSLSKAPTRALTVDHYNNLMAMIESDRCARLALEAQVKKLRHQISRLHMGPSSSNNRHDMDLSMGRAVGATTEFDFDDYGITRHDNRIYPKGNATAGNSAPPTDVDGENYPESIATSEDIFSDSRSDQDQAVNEPSMFSFSRLATINGIQPALIQQTIPQAF